MTDDVLTVAGVTLRFGGVTCLDNVSLNHRRGQVLAVIGPNGAGKTSLFNCIAGAYVPQDGSLLFTAENGAPPADLRGRASSKIARLGVARTFQNIRLFGGLTALENVQVGAEAAHRPSALAAVLGTRGARRSDRASLGVAKDLLHAVGLGHRQHVVSSSLAYGEQRRLEIARALATGPSLLLLDEPAAGTNGAERDELADLILTVNGGGYPGAAGPLSILLIEHDIGLVSTVSRHIVVLNFGKVIAAGTPDEVRTDTSVIEAYLGTDEDEPPHRRAAGTGGTDAP